MLALAALLVALQFIGVLVSNASGHAAYGPAPAPVEWSTSADVADQAGEFATCDDVGQTVDPTSRPAGRDRHRPAAEPHTKPSVGGVRGYEFTALSPGSLTALQCASRSSGAPSLASLQVFRC
ncbi:hypothetical protein AB0D57_27195 [Streptomyces sp. NPDC048275]|uniref:hypothetical protein n=1 Tax=Streptomyces sp. NPDC048275 TaxID=3155629 RepID=UPI0034054D00